MATPTKEETVGKGKQIAGKAKEMTSRLIGDERTAAEGRREQRAGKVQETKGSIKAKVKKAIDTI